MRVVRGLAEGMAALCAERGLDLERVPPSVQAKTEEVFGAPLTPAQAVERILTDVRERGDQAVRELSLKLDGFLPAETEVSSSSIKAAYDTVPETVIDALKTSAGRIRKFHEICLPRGWMDFSEGYGQVIRPVARVGAYIPGGTACYPSTAMMTTIPAKVAGVSEVVVCSPAREGGLPDPTVLVAAHIAGADRVFSIGGAQAIAAMAYGTETVPRVDVVCGPGNIFVTLAKKQVFGTVGVDGLYGPTETVIVADETANPTLCAVDLLAQAEHDVLARPVLITTSDKLAEAVEREAGARLEGLERSSIAGEALEHRGCIVIVESVEEALELSNGFAPEHLSLMVRDPWAYVAGVRNAGAIFVGEFSHEVLGDYVAGPSHVMPTGGTARFSSGLGVHSFLKVSPIVALDTAASGRLGRSAALIARAEGLTAHAEAAEVRQELLEAPP